MPDPNETRFEPDPETGIVYKLVPEGRLAVMCATFGGLYLFLVLALFVWLLFDVWIDRFTLAHVLGYGWITKLVSPTLKAVIYGFIGGGLGGTVNEFRSFTVWHAERAAFGARFIWKVLFAPWIGAILALFAIALLNSGVAVLGADFTGTDAPTRQALSMFALGVLAGYGSRDVSRWLDAQVKRIFSSEPTVIATPTFVGKTRDEAQIIAKTANLNLSVTEQPQTDAAQVGKIVKQSPDPGSRSNVGGKVEVTLGTNPPGHA